MIASNDLRKGNNVLFEGVTCSISQILWNRVEILTASEKGNSYKECEYFQLEPIALTAQIIEKLGFVKQERFHYSSVYQSPKGDFIINQLRDSCEVSFGLNGSFSIVSTREIALHQLQNLYYALVNEELVLNLQHVSLT